MCEHATWLPQSERVDVIQQKEARFGPTVKIRRADGSSLDVPRSQVLMNDDADLIQQLQHILMANNPARDPAYFSTVKNLLRRGAPLQLVAKRTAPTGQQLKIF
ncbi:hypothetical protein SAMN04487897_109127 [Paenibacillus sp. yr247]|uniref:hypothetical protein n=1 Tax=Paenibacillus sp. yr247 TaxID=1761880 RepID=UPI00088E7491|nr:hypothetical protein [Paenibacillus sp. yr247]SDO18139.1 hypothetical protein SAMN04487897_109127 [Paenibacillus sp. yr247]